MDKQADKAGIALPLEANAQEIFDNEGLFVCECDTPETAKWLVFAANAHLDITEMQQRFEVVSARSLEQGALLATIQKKLEHIAMVSNPKDMDARTHVMNCFEAIHKEASQLLEAIRSGDQGEKT